MERSAPQLMEFPVDPLHSIALGSRLAVLPHPAVRGVEGSVGRIVAAGTSEP